MIFMNESWKFATNFPQQTSHLVNQHTIYREKRTHLNIVVLYFRKFQQRRERERDGIESSCYSFHLCGSPTGGCWYCDGVSLEHSLPGWPSLGIFQQSSHLQCMFLSISYTFFFANHRNQGLWSPVTSQGFLTTLTLLGQQ